MKRTLLTVICLLLCCNYALATDITWADKTTGGTFSAADANEVKAAVNSKLDAATMGLPTADNQILQATGVGTFAWTSEIQGIIDDTKGNGDTTYLWSADKIFDSLALKQDADADLPVDAIEFVIGDGSNAIGTGVKGFIEAPWAATINRATVLCDTTGSIVIDVWKDTYANYPPTVADTITASAKPTISSATKYQSSTLTGWTTSITAGDVIGFNVDSAATVTRCTISLKVAK